MKNVLKVLFWIIAIILFPITAGLYFIWPSRIFKDSILINAQVRKHEKALKIYRWAWLTLIVVTIATIAVLVIRTSHHDLAAAPDNIEKIVKVDLPEIASVESENNLDRGASRWDTYIHSGQFTEELSEESIKAIEELCVADRSHWCKEEEYYAYFDRGDIDDLYFVTCIIYHDHFKLTYEVDESEGIFVLFPFVIAYMILLAWGIILFIINLIRGNNKH